MSICYNLFCKRRSITYSACAEYADGNVILKLYNCGDLERFRLNYLGIIVAGVIVVRFTAVNVKLVPSAYLVADLLVYLAYRRARNSAGVGGRRPVGLIIAAHHVEVILVLYYPELLGQHRLNVKLNVFRLGIGGNAVLGLIAGKGHLVKRKAVKEKAYIAYLILPVKNEYYLVCILGVLAGDHLVLL